MSGTHDSAAVPVIAARRLAAQQIARHQFTKPEELVAWMGAIQAQDAAGARWSVGVRLRGPVVNEATIARALDEGTILRTHVMRWTWQLVTPADAQWMLQLVAARLVARAAARHHDLGLDAKTFGRSAAALRRALRDGAHLTRAELGAALRSAGVAASGPRLSHLLGHAELHGVICSGAARGKQPTWALLAQRAPGHHRPLARDEALAELARRYFRSRGPATVADFAWWSGLQPAEARAGLGAVQSELASENVAGAAYFWHSGATPATSAAATPTDRAEAVLLPPFDEYLVAYRDRGAVLARQHALSLNAGGGMLAPAVVVGGRVAGTWRRSLGRDSVTIALQLFDRRPPARVRDAIQAAAARYAAFLGLAPTIHL